MFSQSKLKKMVVLFLSICAATLLSVTYLSAKGGGRGGNGEGNNLGLGQAGQKGKGGAGGGGGNAGGGDNGGGGNGGGAGGGSSSSAGGGAGGGSSSAGGSVRDDPGPACTNTRTDDIDNDHHAVRACRSIGARRGAWIGPGVDDATRVERDTGIVDDSATAIGVPGNKSQRGLDQ